MSKKFEMKPTIDLIDLVPLLNKKKKKLGDMFEEYFTANGIGNDAYNPFYIDNPLDDESKEFRDAVAEVVGLDPKKDPELLIWISY